MIIEHDYRRAEGRFETAEDWEQDIPAHILRRYAVAFCVAVWAIGIAAAAWVAWS